MVDLGHDKAKHTLACSSYYLTTTRATSTLYNRQVYVAVSTLGGLGLFAAKSFEKGAVITAYGGSLRHKDDFIGQPRQRSRHAARIPGSGGMVADGYDWAALFPRPSADVAAAQRALVAQHRTPVFPSTPAGTLHSPTTALLTVLLLLRHGAQPKPVGRGARSSSPADARRRWIHGQSRCASLFAIQLWRGGKV